MNEILKKMNCPDSCIVGNIIYKKMFYENATMNKRDKEIFKDHINKIIWQYSFKLATINLQPYKDDIREYEEVAVLEVSLSNGSKCKRIAEIIQGTIPYPTMIAFVENERVLLNVAHKRTNMADASKNTIEESISTEWIDLSDLTDRQKQFLEDLDIKTLPFSNAYKFYSALVDKLNLFNASSLGLDYSQIKGKDANSIKILKDKIDSLEAKIIELKNSIKKEKHFNKKMKMNVEIKKQEDKKKQLINELKQGTK